MTARSGGGVREVGRKAGSWLYGIMLRAGWKRWLLLGAAAAGVLAILALICDGTDYRKDPSVLVPRSVFLYAETRELGTALNDAGTWTLWNRERLPDMDGQGGPLPEEFAARMGEGIKGLGTNLPLAWISGSRKAAVCFAPADATSGESWAVFLDYPDAAGAMAALRVEPGLSLAPAGGNNIHELSDKNGGKLFFLSLAPWFIISSDMKLPKFAAESVDRPAFSLARTDLVSPWARGLAVRGMIDPGYVLREPASGLRSALIATVASWMTQDARLGFSSGLSLEGMVDAQVDARVLRDTVGGGGLWPLFKFFLGLLGILLIAILVATLLAMVGWSGWLKVLALKAGIAPAVKPAPTTPSDAFKEDAGIHSPDGDAPSDVAATPIQISESDEDGGNGQTKVVEGNPR